MIDMQILQETNSIVLIRVEISKIRELDRGEYTFLPSKNSQVQAQST